MNAMFRDLFTVIDGATREYGRARTRDAIQSAYYGHVNDGVLAQRRSGVVPVAALNAYRYRVSASPNRLIEDAACWRDGRIPEALQAPDHPGPDAPIAMVL